MECYQCSRPLPATTLRCPHCDWPVTERNPVPQPPMCGGCAQFLPENVTYCKYCGWSVDIGEAPAPSPPSSVAEAAPAAEAPPAPKFKPDELYQITRVPLTGEQKRTLIVNIVVPPLSLFIFIVVLTLIPTLMGMMPYGQVLDRIPPFSGWLIVFLMLFGAYSWLRSVCDLGRGVTYVQLTRLSDKSLHRHRDNKRWTHYGFFEKVGKIVISDEAYRTAIMGAIYRLTYSPISKRLWEMELIELPVHLKRDPADAVLITP